MTCYYCKSGLTADIKLGTRNSYSILKFNREERFIEQDNEKQGKSAGREQKSEKYNSHKHGGR